MLWSVGDRLKKLEIRFLPGVNEDLAATAVRGTQQLDAVPGAKTDGVFGAWYGKGPGVDRSIDALKHGNFAGAHPNGGVLAFYGDDHGGKSSTVSHQSEQAMASALIPSLYPANVGELIEFGLLGYALSRHSGSWVGIKCVNEVVEQTASVDVDLPALVPTIPALADLPLEGVHVRNGPYGPLRDEQIVTDFRLPMVRQFVRANRIDQTAFRSTAPRLGLIAAGKSYGDTMAALSMLGLTQERATALGLSLYKVGCIWPLEPEGLVEFSRGHETLFIIEEKKSFVELQAAGILINEARPPRIVGKRDERQKRLLSETLQLDPIEIALAIVGRLRVLGVQDADLDEVAEALTARRSSGPVAPTGAIRTPYFCSGCPHSRSTRIPDGSLSMTGIGCHTMVSLMRPDEALLPTHMGGEGANWIGLAPFTATPHIFQNMGDGTYYHSGLLAIRAAVAAGVNITYKILYNDAVAMTGGQPVDGPLSVAEIAHQVRHEGVGTIAIVSDNPDHHRNMADLPRQVRIEHRDDLDALQRELREVPGCSVLIYEQTCAAEKRRRRKRGIYPDPARRMYIAQAVCEGCGDCSAQSTCVSIVPVETEFGTKRQIDQTSCNKDYSCNLGFCPSFITIDGADPKRPVVGGIDKALFAGLTRPPQAEMNTASFNVMIAGIGGTGVVTVGAILGMAAHLDGWGVSHFDMTGLAQKNGAVYSHLRIARMPATLYAQKLGKGEADLLLAFDLVAAAGNESASTLQPERTRAAVNRNVVPTAAFQFNRDAVPNGAGHYNTLCRHIGAEAVFSADATSLARALLGNEIGANLFLVGVAVQRGLLPVSVEAIQQAVRLNGAAIDLNLTAFALGRLYVADPVAVEAMVPEQNSRRPETSSEVMERMVRHLEAYQSADYALRYRRRVLAAQECEQRLDGVGEELALTVARNYAKLLSYKDEYEVARLLSDPALQSELRERFSKPRKVSFNLAPPSVSKARNDGRPDKLRVPAFLAMPLFGVLKRFKWLRGTPFDVFGYTAERKAERALIAQYEATIDLVLGQVTPDNYTAAVKLLSLPDMVRGFGVVKHTAVQRYQQSREAALSQFRESAGRSNAAEGLDQTP